MRRTNILLDKSLNILFNIKNINDINEILIVCIIRKIPIHIGFPNCIILLHCM